MSQKAAVLPLGAVIRRIIIKTRCVGTSFQTVDKPLDYIKMGSQGRSPRQGLGGPGNIAPFPGKGAWGFGKDAEIERPKALQDAKPTKRSYRDREQALFLQAETALRIKTQGGLLK